MDFSNTQENNKSFQISFRNQQHNPINTNTTDVKKHGTTGTHRLSCSDFNNVYVTQAGRT